MEVKKLNRLKVVMAEKDLSNIWLSEKLGVSQATVSKWMTNFSQPNIETLIKISKVLNVEVAEHVFKLANLQYFLCFCKSYCSKLKT